MTRCKIWKIICLIITMAIKLKMHRNLSFINSIPLNKMPSSHSSNPHSKPQKLQYNRLEIHYFTKNLLSNHQFNPTKNCAHSQCKTIFLIKSPLLNLTITPITMQLTHQCWIVALTIWTHLLIMLLNFRIKIKRLKSQNLT